MTELTGLSARLPAYLGRNLNGQAVPTKVGVGEEVERAFPTPCNRQVPGQVPRGCYPTSVAGRLDFP
jgi:hypothetical protein